MVLFFPSIGDAKTQPPGIDDSIMAIRHKWEKIPDFVNAHDLALKPVELPLIFKKTDSIGAFFREAYPEPRGTEASWYASIIGTPYFTGGPSPYQCMCIFKYYYYNTAYRKLVPNGEPGTQAYVYVNSFRFLLQATGLQAEIDAKAKNIYEVCKTEGEWKGYPVYQLNDNSYKNYKMVLLTKKGKLPWKPISQLQYLQAFRSKRLRETKEATDNLDREITRLRQDLDKMKADKRFATLSGKEVVAAAQSAYDKQVASKDKYVKSFIDLLESDLKKVEDYMRSVPAAILQQQAVIRSSTGPNVFHGFIDLSNPTARQLIYIDQAYFNKSLPSYEPQFMVVAWTWRDAVPSTYFKDQFEKKFPIAKLQAMIRDGKPPALSEQKKIEQEIKAMVNATVGKNNETTWAAIRQKIDTYLNSQWKSGKLSGLTASQAYYVKADRTTMTPNDVANSRLIVEVGLAFNKPAEFEIIRFENLLR